MLLNLHSWHSLRYGTLSIQQLVKGMQYYGYTTGVLTDINNTSAIFPFIKACKTAGINGLAGVEFRNGSELLYIGIARDRKSTRLNSSHVAISYAVFCLIKQTATKTTVTVGMT